MAYRTVAVRPETKERLDALRREAGFSSLDEVVAAAVGEFERARAEEEVRRLVGRSGKTRPSILDEAEEALVGLDETVRAVRRGMARRFARRNRA